MVSVGPGLPGDRNAAGVGTTGVGPDRVPETTVNLPGTIRLTTPLVYLCAA